ncbi:MAG: DUF5674 family protein [Lachnospiraceae bacterium]|nr:DUF5674 family protein [Lachnospiraceae bacterium]
MILKEAVRLEELWELDPQYFPNMIKFCLDRKRRVVAVNEEMHNDLEYELYDDGSDEHDIYGGNIMKSPVSVVWTAHPNISRNRELGIGAGRERTDQTVIDELFEILKEYIK